MMPNAMQVVLDGEFVCQRDDGDIYLFDGKYYLLQEEWNGLSVGYVVYPLENVTC